MCGFANLRYREQAGHIEGSHRCSYITEKSGNLIYYSALYMHNIALTRLEEAMGSETDKIVISQHEGEKDA